ncbi:MAG: HAMP domain-containing histidine kinase [Clostridia bacterium]|nr:HAMP domain-containing histidine kinase [Clostridia bacterium]
MNDDIKIKKILRSISHFLVIFLLVAFVISCCTMLFVTLLSEAADMTLTGDVLNAAAKLTLINVVFLSLLLTVLDALRRKFTVDRTVKRITDAAKRITEGDFSVRIEKTGDEAFSQIIDCLNIMAEELSGTETLRTDFIANVSHELKTPLSVMQNYATLLKSPHITEEERIEYADAINGASKRLANLITNILKLNKLENQQITPKCETYDLSEQLCECLLSYEHAWEKKGLNIETDIEDGVTVMSDPEMMSLVWNNLISNAVKFTGEGGTVSLSVKNENGYAVVTVSDTGCGISPEVGKHIFDKFYQGDTSHATQGNGLGLALVKRVIDITGCDISLTSEPGKGSSFRVSIKNEGL